MTRPSKRTTRRAPTPDEALRLKVSKPDDLVGLIPYLLGFRPNESLVAVLIQGSQVVLSARIDLPPAELADDVVDHFVQLAGQTEASALVLLAFSQDTAAARALLETLVPGLAPYGLLDALHVGEHRWWSLMCTGSCCPPEGKAYDLSSHRLAAEAVYAGLTAAEGRGAIESLVHGPTAGEPARLEQITRQVVSEVVVLSVRRRSVAMSEAVTSFVAEPRELSEDECARLAVLGADVVVRDVAWELMSRADVDAHLDLWGQVVRRAVPPWEVAPVCLLGLAGWISGNGALQNCCTDRALRIDPDYSLALLLADINQRALPPSFWDVLARDMKGSARSVAG